MEDNQTRVRYSHTFQYRQYQSMTFDATLVVPTAEDEPAMIAAGITTIQEGFGLALWHILKRYNENKTDEQLTAEVRAIMPPALAVTLTVNETVMDSLLLAARRRLDE